MKGSFFVFAVFGNDAAIYWRLQFTQRSLYILRNSWTTDLTTLLEHFMNRVNFIAILIIDAIWLVPIALKHTFM